MDGCVRFSDEKLNMAQMKESFFERQKNNVEKWENSVKPITTQYRILMHSRYIAVENIATSSFSFSHNVFYPTWYLFSILNAHLNVVCNLFQFGPV